MTDPVARTQGTSTVGIENVPDLRADLDRALSVAG
jgi:cystathionine beta-lyase/cystathionine gamma-synthase